VSVGLLRVSLLREFKCRFGITAATIRREYSGRFEGITTK
jgi:hypothetical protein